MKSNSCASRLELTGTNHTNHIDDNRLNNRNNSVSNLDHEESVRTIIRRIESNSFNSKKVPRIIESKCIEKTTAAASNDAKSKHVQFQFGKDADAVLANQTVAPATASPATAPPATVPSAQKSDRLGPAEILSQVSVNNHINSINASAIGVAAVAAAAAAAALADKPPVKSNIMSRNRNVDLALEISKHHHNKNAVSKLSKDKANGLKKNGDAADTTTVTTKTTSGSTNAPKAKHIDNESLQNMMDDLSAAIAKTEIHHHNNGNGPATGGNNTVIHQNGKLTKWDTLTAFDEKNYIANDISLKQKPKYDDIEFEEFEVIDPNT